MKMKEIVEGVADLPLITFDEDDEGEDAEAGAATPLRAEDFGPDGTATVDMVRPPGAATSVCHSIRAFDADGEPMGH